MTPVRALGALAAAAGLAVAACSTAPPAQRIEPGPPAAPAAASDFEREWLARARDLARSGSHAEAADAWEILSLYRPAQGDYRRQMENARADAARNAHDHLRRARRALAAGDEQNAARELLRALAAEPDNTEARDRLRALDVVRNQRHYLGRPSRLTIGKRHDFRSPASPAAPAAKPDLGQSAPREVETDDAAREHAALLLHDGEFTEALALLARHLATHPDDAAARTDLGQAWLGYGENALAEGRPETALRAFERAREYLPESAGSLDARIAALRAAAR